MNAVEKWKRMTNPKTVEDYGLGITLNELLETEEGKKIFQEEIKPWLPLDVDLPSPK